MVFSMRHLFDFLQAALQLLYERGADRRIFFPAKTSEETNVYMVIIDHVVAGNRIAL